MNNKNELKKDENKAIIEGVIKLTARGVGYVERDDGVSVKKGRGNDIEIDSTRLNTALHGDVVRMRLLPKIDGRRQAGEIIEILFRNRIRFVGTIHKETGVSFVVVDDPKMYADIILPEKDTQNVKDGDKVYVKIEVWNDHKENPVGEIIKIIGKEGENETEMRAIVLERGFETDFPKDVIASAEEISKEISSADITNRRDMRNTLTFTIDPEDAKDFDDALSFKELKNDLYEIGVHIADVTHYVSPDTKIDKEALKRGTSIYLVDRTIPMLPEVLSNNLCSLMPNVDRLSFSVIWTITKDGNIENEWFGRTVIHSNKRFSYETAQSLIDSPDTSDCSNALAKIRLITNHLRKKRFEKGAIDFDSTEVRFELSKSGKPIAVRIKERLETNRLIEEWMLLANKRVAEFISKKDKHAAKTFVYRIHNLPNKEKIIELASFLKTLGYHLPAKDGVVNSKDINELLRKTQGTAEEQLINIATLRSMAKAIYSTDNIGHYGLAFEHYTHFTSPIRRYPDMLVHRLLQKYLDKKKVSEEELVNFRNIADYASRMEQTATDAERASIKYKQTEYMSGHIGKEFDASITGVTEWGIFAEINDTKSEGMIRLSSLKNDFFVLDDKHHILRGQRTKKTYRLGDSVRVKVVRADIKRKSIDFEIIRPAA